MMLDFGEAGLARSVIFCLMMNLQLNCNQIERQTGLCPTVAPLLYMGGGSEFILWWPWISSIQFILVGGAPIIILSKKKKRA